MNNPPVHAQSMDSAIYNTKLAIALGGSSSVPETQTNPANMLPLTTVGRISIDAI